jgi:hypothetical protein
MNARFWISVAALFVLSSALGVAVHGTLLQPDYARLQHLFRTTADSEAYLPYMMAAHLAIALAFTWIYRQGRDQRPWLGQGVRFGLAVALLFPVPMFLIYYAVQPMPSDVVAKQIVLETLGMVIMGMVAAFVNRDPRPARA